MLHTPSPIILKRRLVRSYGSRWVGLLVLVLTACFFFTLPRPAAGDMGVDPAAQLVHEIVAEARAATADPAIGAVERRERFRALLRARFDLQRSALAALGPYRARATAAEIAEYVALYEERTVDRWVGPFGEFASRRYTIHAVEPVAAAAANAPSDTALVRSSFHIGAAAPVAVGWRVATDADGVFRVTDLDVYGVSLAEMQQDEFASVIRANGNRVGALIARLRSIDES
jgi:phospholipid transport system substrate-binding protein